MNNLYLILQKLFWIQMMVNSCLNYYLIAQTALLEMRLVIWCDILLVNAKWLSKNNY